MHTAHPTASPAQEAPDIREKGATKDGVPQISDKRLFLQFQAFDNCYDIEKVKSDLAASGISSVLYFDVNNPNGIGVLTLTDDPQDFVDKARPVFNGETFRAMNHRPEMTMLGRTYSIGHEADLNDWLLEHPRRRVMNPAWPWAIWYPLRRKPEFELLPKSEQGAILREHAMIGKSYGNAGYGYDVRLMCHGLDTQDNDFVIGLIGAELYPLSRIVQEMRKTKQTAQYITSLGPFFVGKVAWQSHPLQST